MPPKKNCTVLKEWIPVMAGIKCEVLAEVLASAPWSSSPREEQRQSPHRLASVCARLGRRRGQGAWSAVRLPIGCVGTPCAQDRRASKDWGSHGWPQTSYNQSTTIAVLDDSSPHVKNLPGGQNSKKPRVLTPGSGLSRLPFECARRGYAAQGNEFSYHMLQGCKWVLGRCICLLLFFSLSSHSNHRTIQYLLKWTWRWQVWAVQKCASLVGLMISFLVMSHFCSIKSHFCWIPMFPVFVPGTPLLILLFVPLIHFLFARRSWLRCWMRQKQNEATPSSPSFLYLDIQSRAGMLLDVVTNSGKLIIEVYRSFVSPFFCSHTSITLWV